MHHLRRGQLLVVERLGVMRAVPYGHRRGRQHGGGPGDVCVRGRLLLLRRRVRSTAPLRRRLDVVGNGRVPVRRVHGVREQPLDDGDVLRDGRHDLRRGLPRGLLYYGRRHGPVLAVRREHVLDEHKRHAGLHGLPGDGGLLAVDRDRRDELRLRRALSLVDDRGRLRAPSLVRGRGRLLSLELRALHVLHVLRRGLLRVDRMQRDVQHDLQRVPCRHLLGAGGR